MFVFCVFFFFLQGKCKTMKILQYSACIRPWNCLIIFAHKKPSCTPKCHFGTEKKKKVILSLSLWTHQTFKGFLSVVQRWTELICSVRDTHLNPVWMKVNTFTLVTTVCIKTEKQLGPGRHACTVGKFRGAQIPAWFPSHTVNPLSLSVIFSSGLLNESIK